MDLDELNTEVETARFTKQSVRTLQSDRVSGRGIPFVKIGRNVRYRKADIIAFIEKNTVRSTTEADQLRRMEAAE